MTLTGSTILAGGNLWCPGSMEWVKSVPWPLIIFFVDFYISDTNDSGTQTIPLLESYVL